MSFTYKIVQNFLTKEECDSILNFTLENLKLKPAEIISKNTDGVDDNTRKSNVVFYPYYKKFPILLEKISKLLKENIIIKGFDLDYEYSEFQFTEYKDGDYFAWHKDVYGDKITEQDRYCSVVIQLNNEYEDGNLEVEVDNGKTISIEKNAGDIIIFLSNMLHRVTTVKNGNRYTLVNWVGLKKQNNYKQTLL